MQVKSGWLLIFSLMIAPAFCRAQITSNVFTRILSVRIGGENPKAVTGTAFTLEVDGRQYVITAKHVVAALGDEGTLEIYRGEKWSPLKVKVLRCPDPIDIAVVVAPMQLTGTYDLPYDPSGVEFGQDAYFLGFPYGMMMSGKNVNGDSPIAFAKRATMSATRPVDTGKKAVVIELDGFNNPGFSGGPIVYRDFHQPGFVYKLLGVVSGFKPEFLPVVSPKPIPNADAASPEAKAEGWRIVQNASTKQWFEMVDNGTFVASNTGIVEGYMLAPAIDLIKAHPIGPQVSPTP
jgi:hypothetical protein